MNDKSVNSAYRELRTNIQYNDKHPDVKSICVTGVDFKSDSTSVAINLAVTFAANNSKVLLLDCNVKNPTIQKSINVEKSIGLTDILINNDYDNYYKYCTNFKDEYSNNLLYVMGSGKKVNYPLDLLSSNNFITFMETMKKQFDFVIVDCPSFTSNIDVIPVSHTVDGTILVISLAETEKILAKKCLKRLRRNGVKILGVVLNQVE